MKIWFKLHLSLYLLKTMTLEENLSHLLKNSRNLLIHFYLPSLLAPLYYH